MHLTWLDSNSWLIEMGGQRILLDPWLVGSLMFGNLPWLFKGDRPTPRPIPEDLDLILLSQGLADHAHLPTLEQLDRRIPVVGSPNAVKVVEKLGYTQITTLAHGEKTVLANRLQIQATPGSLVGFQLVENGYWLQDLSNGQSLYYEPHGSHHPSLKDLAPVDVIITPLMNLELPLVGAIITGNQRALEVAQWLHPQVMIHTAAGGDITLTGLLPPLIQAVGSLDEFQATLIQNHLSTQVLKAKPGDRMAINLTTKTSDPSRSSL